MRRRRRSGGGGGAAVRRKEAAAAAGQQRRRKEAAAQAPACNKSAGSSAALLGCSAGRRRRRGTCGARWPAVRARARADAGETDQPDVPRGGRPKQVAQQALRLPLRASAPAWRSGDSPDGADCTTEVGQQDADNLQGWNAAPACACSATAPACCGSIGRALPQPFLALAVVVYRLKDGIWPGGRVQGVRWSTGRCKWAGGSEGDGGAGIGSVELMRQKTDGQCGRKQMASDQGSSLFVSLVSCSGRLVGKCAALGMLQRGGSVRRGEWAGQMLVGQGSARQLLQGSCSTWRGFMPGAACPHWQA